MPKTRPTLRTKKEIDALFKSAKKLGVIRGIDLRIAPKTFPESKILIVTPRSIGNAPARNLIRRRIKEIFKPLRTTSPYDCVVLIKKEALLLSFHELQAILHNALS